MSDQKTIRNIVAENPLLILFLGACPAMGRTTSLISALGMGVAVLVVLVLSTALMSALRGVTPEKARVPAAVIIAAGFVSIVQMLMNAFLPNVYQMLCVYLAVTAVDLLVLSQAEAAAEKRGSLADSVKIGVYFLAVLTVMGAVRELFGAGSIAGVSVPVLESHRILVLTKAPGGFLVFSILAAVISKVCPVKGKPLCEGSACAAAGIAEINTEGE